MSRAVALSLSPTEVFDAEQEKTLRQFAIAAGVSLVAHALVLLLFIAPNYEEARRRHRRRTAERGGCHRKKC